MFVECGGLLAQQLPLSSECSWISKVAQDNFFESRGLSMLSFDYITSRCRACTISGLSRRPLLPHGTQL